MTVFRSVSSLRPFLLIATLDEQSHREFGIRMPFLGAFAGARNGDFMTF